LASLFEGDKMSEPASNASPGAPIPLRGTQNKTCCQIYGNG
jgi:hypothetical protein